MMVRRMLFVAGALSLTACSATLQRPVETTEAATQLEQVTHSDTNEFDPAIAPDAGSIAYEVAATPDTTPHLEVMSLKGADQNARAVTYGSGDETGREPAWMPDGSGVIFVSRSDPSKSLMEMIGHGVGQAPFVGEAGGPLMSSAWPAISPDGAKVAMSLGDVEAFHTGWHTIVDFDQQIGLSNLLGTDVSFIGKGTEPSWSPDGKRLAFVRQSEGRAHVFVANADGSDAHAITEGSSDDVEPTWSPDGKVIAFCSVHTVGESAQANIFLTAPDGSGLVQLTEGDRLACRPSWGTDGFIYFHANATDHFHIWRMRPSGARG